MDKKFLKQQKKKLKEEKEKIEKGLKAFAKKDPHIKDNWETKMPDFGIKTADPAEETDQIEEYEANLSIEYNLEKQIQKIKQALKNIKGGTYGMCQKCGKKIDIKRLKACPEAILCIQCSKQET